MAEAHAPKPAARGPRTRLANLGLLVASTLIALSAAELALRLFGYEGARERATVAFDDRYGDIPKDAWPLHVAIAPGQSEVTIDGAAYRVAKPPGSVRIAFVGDSGTQGAGVQPGQAFPWRFRARLPEATRQRVDVMNLGLSGLTTVGELNLIQSHVLRFRPDIVVLGFFLANDIQFNLQHVRSFRRPALVNALRRRSALAHFVYQRLLVLGSKYRIGRGASGDSAPGELVNVSLVEEHGISMLEYVPGEFTTYLSPIPPTVELAYQVTKSTLARIVELGREHGFTLVVVLIPTLSSLVGRLEFPGETGEEAELLSRLGPGDRIDVDQPARRIAADCDELDVVYVDPTPRLRDKLGAAAILPNDDHPTPEAHDIIAEMLIAQLELGQLRFVRSGPR